MADTFQVIETQEQLNAIITERLNRAKQQHDAAITALNTTIQELTAENTRLKGVADQTANMDTELATLRQKVTDYETDSAKRDIAEEFGLPKGFHSRLRGATPEELKADAAALAQIVKANQTVPSPLASTEAGVNMDATAAAFKTMLNNKGE